MLKLYHSLKENSKVFYRTLTKIGFYDKILISQGFFEKLSFGSKFTNLALQKIKKEVTEMTVTTIADVKTAVDVAEKIYKIQHNEFWKDVEKYRDDKSGLLFFNKITAETKKKGGELLDELLVNLAEAAYNKRISRKDLEKAMTFVNKYWSNFTGTRVKARGWIIVNFFGGNGHQHGYPHYGVW